MWLWGTANGILIRVHLHFKPSQDWQWKCGRSFTSGGLCAINWMPHSCFQVSTSEKILTSLLGFSTTAKDSLSTNAELISFQRHQPCDLAELFANWHSSEQRTELWGNKQKAYHFPFSSLNLLSSCSFHSDVCPWLRRRNCVSKACVYPQCGSSHMLQPWRKQDADEIYV